MPPHDGRVRHYHVHMTDQLCAKLKLKAGNLDRKPPRVLFALHCFGCTAGAFWSPHTSSVSCPCPCHVTPQ